MFDRKKFDEDKYSRIPKSHESKELNNAALDFVIASDRENYAYNWTWLNLPIIQMPEDIVIAQEIIWDIKPDIIIETGIAWGGSVALNASILELIGKGSVHAIDAVLPEHNISAIKDYKFSNRIHLYSGSSTDEGIVNRISSHIKEDDTVMLLLDSNHTHEHVYNELQVFSKFIKPGGYIVVSDTIIEEIPEQIHRPRPWGKGDNPRTALDKFLLENERFSRDNEYNHKALNSYTRNGYVKCIE